MSDSEHRASARAAQGVEQIIDAAQDAADAIRNEAEVERKAAREKSARDADRVLQKARDQGETELNQARRKAVALGQEAQREAEETVANAQREAGAVEEHTRRSVEGRVAAAEKSAAQVLAEAQALSGGLRQLAQSLEGQAARILHDVQAAHKRMQADLRVESGSEHPSRRGRESGDTPPPGRGRDTEPAQGRSAEPPARRRPAASRDGDEPSTSSRERSNLFDDLEIPRWSRD